MIDAHCHLLPNIDDGADCIATSLALARIAVRDGIQHSVCTPHIHLGRYHNTSNSIEQCFLAFKQALEQADIPLQISYAAEVRFDADILPALDRGDIPFLGEFEGDKVLLLELPHGLIPLGIETFIDLLQKKGIRCMIAHPERNREAMRKPSKLRPLLDKGCLFQITAGSIAGAFGDKAQELALALLKENKVTLIASDAHNERHRPPILSAGIQVAGSYIGEAAASKLVVDAPAKIINLAST